MTPLPGDLIQSNKAGCNRYRVEKSGRDDSGIWWSGVVYLPDWLKHGGKVHVTHSGLTEQNGMLVGRWTHPDESEYEYLTDGCVPGQPARIEFRVIGRAQREEQLDLFGDAV